MNKVGRIAPFLLKLPRVYYGWWIVGACFLVAFYTGGVVFFGFTAVFEPIAKEFGWSYAKVSLAASLRGLEIGLLAPIVGTLVDRWGPRKLMFGGMIIAGLGLLLLSRTTSLGMFYGAFVLVAAGVSTGSTTVTMATVANWFRRKVGIATGITICGYGSSGLIIPLMVRLIDQYGWRTSMVILALGMFLVCLPLVLLIRHKPEHYGYLPDGETANNTALSGNGFASVQTAEINIGARQALKSRAFWHIALGFMFHLAAVTTVTTHVMPYLSSIGVARSMSGLVATAIPLFSVLGRFGFGWFADKIDKKRLTILAFALLTLGLLSFEFVDTAGFWLMVPFLALFGIGYGGNATMTATLTMEYFGRGSFGAIIGCLNGVMILGSIAGPPLAGWVFDYWGNYQGVWLAFATLTGLGTVILAMTPPVYPTAE